MDLQTCETCQYWRRDDKDTERGGCYRYAPRPQSMSGDSPYVVSWPVSYIDDWCGEWREKKVE